MGEQHLPLILIELVLVFGGVLLFGWWQLRSVARDQRAAQAAKKAQDAAQAREAGSLDSARADVGDPARRDDDAPAP